MRLSLYIYFIWKNSLFTVFSSIFIQIFDCDLTHVAADYDYTGPDVCRYVKNTILISQLSFIRWWCAPEVLFDKKQYYDKLDIWSIGCIMAELILLHPLFCRTGHIDQIDKIFDIIGTPDSAILNDICLPGHSPI
jgi:serine/threonine protein kinase